MKPLKRKFHYGNSEVQIETGQIARQANSAIIVNIDDTVVMTTWLQKMMVSQKIFPLTVNYQGKHMQLENSGVILNAKADHQEKET